MQKSKTFQVLFAGAGGCGKSPVANYLSWKFNLPRMENDALRNEVKEDLLDDLNNPAVLAEYKKRLKDRYKELAELGWSFVDDCSIDRTWFTRDDWYDETKEPFIISFDLSEEFIRQSYEAKHYTYSPPMMRHLSKWVEDHSRFLEQFGDQVNVHITEQNYPERLKICEQALADFTKTL